MQIPPFPVHTSSKQDVEEREREIERDFHTPLGGTYLVSWIIVILLVIGILVLLILFHPM